MRITIDRIDENIAVLDVDGQSIEFPVAALPEGAKEGDVLAFVTVDASQILADAKDRISRMKNMSGGSNNASFDI